MERRTEVAIVGELNLDLILEGLPRDLPEERELLASNFTMTLGSSSAILAHNLALLGTSVSFSSLVGPDPLGALCCQWLREAGVLTDQIRCATILAAREQPLRAQCQLAGNSQVATAIVPAFSPKYAILTATTP